MFCEGLDESDATDFLTFVSKVKNASHAATPRSRRQPQQQQQQQQGSLTSGIILPPLSASVSSQSSPFSLTGSSLPAFSHPSFPASLLALPPALPVSATTISTATILPPHALQQPQQTQSQQSMMTTFKVGLTSLPKNSQARHVVHTPTPTPAPLSLPSILPVHSVISQAPQLPQAAFMGRMLVPIMKPSSAPSPVAPPSLAPAEKPAFEVDDKKQAKKYHNEGTAFFFFFSLAILLQLAVSLLE